VILDFFHRPAALVGVCTVSVVRRKKNIVEKRLYLACLSRLDKHNPPAPAESISGTGTGQRPDRPDLNHGERRIFLPRWPLTFFPATLIIKYTGFPNRGQSVLRFANSSFFFRITIIQTEISFPHLGEIQEKARDRAFKPTH
jgi:hypothetical protein